MNCYLSAHGGKPVVNTLPCHCLKKLALLLVVCACTTTIADNTFTSEEVIDALNQRDRAIENARVDFRRSIYLPPRNEASTTRILDDQGKVVKEFTTNDAVPEQRFLTRHIMTVVGSDMVRLDNYELKKNEETGEDFKHWSTTIDWGDERRMTPDDTRQVLSIYKGYPDRRGTEPIGNEHALVTRLKEIMSKNKKVKPSDILHVESVNIEGQALLRLTTKPNRDLNIPETELLIDPSKSFVVLRSSLWVPSKSNRSREKVTYYNDIVKGEDGIWYPTQIKKESYRYTGEEKEGDSPQLVKRDEFTITSFEMNVTDINVEKLFGRQLPPDRTVMDYRLNSNEPMTFNTSSGEVDMALFDRVENLDKANYGAISEKTAASGQGQTLTSLEKETNLSLIGTSHLGTSEKQAASAYWKVGVVIAVALVSVAFYVLRRRKA